MKLSELQKHIKSLAVLEETECGVISCYLSNPQTLSDHAFFSDRMRLISAGLAKEAQPAFEQASQQVEAFLRSRLDSDTSGLAAFARGGRQPFFLGLQFAVPFENFLSLASTPHIYQLVELKDNYHRYVVLICSSEHAKILEVSLGSVTEQLWKERPALRERVGHEWTRTHYQKHIRERTENFVREMIRILDKLMAAGGHTHLILAGNPNVTARVKKLLPRHLLVKLVDVVHTSEEISRVVADTLQVFLKKEEEESQEVAQLMIREIETHGLAAAGAASTYRALMRGQADVLILAKEYRPEKAWVCPICLMVSQQPGAICPRCLHTDMKEMYIKQEMVRLAEENDCKVEVVEDLPALMAYGGVGCLLRYRIPEEFQSFPEAQSLSR